MGGVDLSIMWICKGQGSKVPARVGGVDLSTLNGHGKELQRSPRPCGRGGFKLHELLPGCLPARPRPCGRGGFKLDEEEREHFTMSPRPCGRGGFKHSMLVPQKQGLCPRPCGRGGFKLTEDDRNTRARRPRPVWAGWI